VFILIIVRILRYIISFNVDDFHYDFLIVATKATMSTTEATTMVTIMVTTMVTAVTTTTISLIIEMDTFLIIQINLNLAYHTYFMARIT